MSAPPPPAAPRPLFSHIPRAESRALFFSLAAALLLLGLKFFAYYLTGSAAVLSDALESIVNVVAAAFALYALRLAHAPADADHPYGHGKIEFFSAGFEGGGILLAAIFIAAHAVHDLLWPHPIESVSSGLYLLLLAMLVNGALGLYLIRSGRKHGSLTIEADGHHLLSDAVTSVAVITALLLIKLTGYTRIDPVAALLVAAYLAHLSLRLLRRSAAGLMDEQDAGDDRLIRSILDAHLCPTGREPQICSYHKLRHRHTGRYHWVDMHLVVPPHLDITTAHQLASTIEYEIEQHLGPGNATAHVEPCKDLAHHHDQQDAQS